MSISPYGSHSINYNNKPEEKINGLPKPKSVPVKGYSVDETPKVARKGLTEVKGLQSLYL